MKDSENKKRINKYILVISVGVFIVFVGNLLIRFENSYQRHIHAINHSSLLSGPETLDGYLRLDNVPSVFEISPYSPYGSPTYIFHGEESSNPCKASVSVVSDVSLDEAIDHYRHLHERKKSVNENGIKWTYFQVKENGNFFNTRYEDEKHYYFAEVYGKIAIFSIGYNGNNSGKCFDYEKDFLKSIHLAS